jgi:hypothetical protein
VHELVLNKINKGEIRIRIRTAVERKRGSYGRSNTLYFGGSRGEKEHHFVRRFPDSALSSFSQ